ncbi:MAG TPA: beta-L-arabinofuranosidase domain-containing protein [Chitinophagaceae bacterium]|nr:beta-L-arabinofuranosidase domain-containing protein [Chitinophagaceae bacterium]
MKKILIGSAFFAASLTAICWHNAAGFTVSTVTRPSTAVYNSNYISNRQPLQPLAFIKLPVGSIVPRGWIKTYLERQRDGLTGHLGEISAWLDKKNNAWYSGNGEGDHGWEEVPYWLKGYGDLAYLLRDTAMIAETKGWLEKVFESQRPDGFFGPVNLQRSQKHPRGLQDVWANMIMLWTMQSYYEYSKDQRVINLMDRYFKWETTVPDSLFLKTYWENSRGGDNLYSIYWLYNITGEPWLLDLARKVHRNTANWTQANTLPNFHNVNVAQCFREPATYYMQTKDSFFLNATYNDFHIIRNMYGQVPGGMFGADEDARKGYTDPRQAVETCGMVEQMASDEILARITGDPFWADHCEDVAFNTYPAAVMPDFKSLRYLTAPNMAVSDTMNHSPGIQNDGPFLMMNPFSSRCCQHNHAQGWPYYAENMWMATPDNGLAAMLYNSCDVTAKVGIGKTVTLKEDTHYPFDENITITVSKADNIQFPLYIRIPAWCDAAVIKVNGVTVKHTSLALSYTRIENTWKTGDKIEINLPMKVQLKVWNENKNSVSVNYGPLTFSLKIKEDYKKEDSRSAAISDSRWQPNADATKWPSYQIFPGSAWNYGLEEKDVQNIDAAKAFTVVHKPWPASNFPFTENDVPLIIETDGKQIPQWQLDKYGLVAVLPESPVNVTTEDEKIELIPMGAARLRISAFPVVR